MAEDLRQCISSMPGEEVMHYSVELTTTQSYYRVISSMTVGHKGKSLERATKVQKAD